MTKKTRTVLFLILVILFFVVAPSIILYSQGWRFDINSKRIVKIGGLYFRVLPKRVNVFVDGKHYLTDYLFGAKFVEGLLPGEYEIRIEKQGFLPWKKKLKIEEEKTTKVEGIFLIPEKISFEILTKEIKDFFPTTNPEKLILLSEKQGGGLKLLELKNNLIAQLSTEKDIKELIKLEKMTFSETGEKIFFLAEDELFEKNLAEEESYPILKDVLSYQIKKELIYYFNSSGFLFKTDLEAKRKEKLNENALAILEQGLQIKISPDLKKIAFYGKHEAWLLFLEKNEGQPPREKEEKLFLARFSENIDDLFWYESNYLIFRVGEKIKVCETDQRDKIQIWDLEGIEAERFFFSPENEKLYFLKDGNLFMTESLF